MSMNRPSLMDMDDFSSVGSKKGPGGKKSGGGNNLDSAKIAKLAVAVVVLLLAGVVWAWQMGLFSPDPAAEHRLTAEETAEIEKELEEEEARREQLLKERKIIVGGA